MPYTIHLKSQFLTIVIYYKFLFFYIHQDTFIQLVNRCKVLPGLFMEPFAHDKAEGAKKVIVASSSSSTPGLRARSSKTLGSPRHGKNRATKSYSAAGNLNGSLISLPWRSTSGLGSQLSPGNTSSEKIPLGHYRTGSSIEDSLPGMQLNSNEFLPDSSVAKFNAALFSSVTSHTNQEFDVEEAMDIDHQEVDDDNAACPEESNSSEPGTSEERSLPGGESNSVSSDVRSKVQQYCISNSI